MERLLEPPPGPDRVPFELEEMADLEEEWPKYRGHEM